jgi:hypothetical protein
MLTDILEELIDSEPDMRIVGACREHESVPAMAAARAVDVVVAALPGSQVPSVYASSLAVMEIGSGPRPIGIASLEGVLAAIRTCGCGRKPSPARAGDAEASGGAGT